MSWIHVKDKKPEYDTFVITFDPSMVDDTVKSEDRVGESLYTEGNGFVKFSPMRMDFVILSNITHWQPLPSPPEN